MEETQMIRNVFEFDDIPVDEICTHRREAVMLYLEDTPEEWEEVIRTIVIRIIRWSARARTTLWEFWIRKIISGQTTEAEKIS